MSLTVISSARLHLGFYNLVNNGKAYGSIGVSISKPIVKVKISSSKTKKIICSDNQLISIVNKVLNTLKITNVNIEILNNIPRHVGLGSTTQLMLSVAYGITRLYNLNFSIRDLAVKLGRGHTSGIGIATFEHGGFIVDGGRKITNGKVSVPSNINELPPIIFRRSLPRNWYFILAIPEGVRGLDESEERKYLDVPAEVDPDLSYELYKTTILSLIPSVIEKNPVYFGKAITKIQFLIGKYFSRYQGGVFCSDETEFFVNKFLDNGAYGAGQSSWGPTAYGIIVGIKAAKKLFLKIVNEAYRKGIKAQYEIVNIRNSGVKII